MKDINLFPHLLKSESIKFNALDNNKYDLYIEEDSDVYSNIFIEGVNSNNVEININVKDYSILHLLIFTRSIKSYVLNINLSKSSILYLTTSDSYTSNSQVDKNINILGENVEVNVYEYVSQKDKLTTKGTFNLNHYAKNSISKGKFMYLSKDTSFIDRDIVANIPGGMTNSTSTESIKGLLLNEHSHIDAKPILKISLDDVHAAHGCAIGTIDSNEIYYLMSRGLTKEDATKIICYSLINPVLEATSDEEFKSLIKPYLEDSIS